MSDPKKDQPTEAFKVSVCVVTDTGEAQKPSAPKQDDDHGPWVGGDGATL